MLDFKHNKMELTSTQKRYLKALKVELKNLILLGQTESSKYWEIVESITSLENNL